MKRTLVGLSLVAAAVGCATESPPPAPEASAEPSVAVVPAATSGRGAAERFLATWNTRDPEQWAGSLNYPHARPSAARSRVWPTRQAYVDTVDFARVIATGWDHTEFEDLRVIHEGEGKAHVAGRWARFDAAGEVIRRNLVTYVATEDGHWGIQAAIATVEAFLAAFNARDTAGVAATFNYPHLFTVDDDVQEWDDAEAFVGSWDFEAFATRAGGWHRTAWDAVEAVQVAESGINVALTLTRYDAEDAPIATASALWLVTDDAGEWGVRARSFISP